MGFKDILAGLIITYATLTPISVLAQEAIQTETKEELAPHSVTYVRLEDYQEVSARFTDLTLSEEDGIVKLCGSLFREQNQTSLIPLEFVIRKKDDAVDIWTYDSITGEFSRGNQYDFDSVIQGRINQESLARLNKQSIEEILLTIDPEQYRSQVDAVVKAEGYIACGIMAWRDHPHWACNYKKSDEENFRLHTHNLSSKVTQAVCLGRSSSRVDSEIQRFFDDYRFEAKFYTCGEDRILYLNHFLGDIHDAYFIRRPNKKTEFRGWIPAQQDKPDFCRHLHIKIVYDQDGNIESNTLTEYKDKKETSENHISESAAKKLYSIGVPILDRCVKALE